MNEKLKMQGKENGNSSEGNLNGGTIEETHGWFGNKIRCGCRTAKEEIDPSSKRGEQRSKIE